MVKVSIIMGIYNCEDTLEEAINSILKQTFKNWELIMCDDASIDDTYEIAFSFSKKYSNIHVYKNKINLGLNKTLNKCLKYAKGTYIARMDGDDISLPQRLEKEYLFLEANPQYSIVSTPMIHFDENGDFAIGKVINKPTKYDLIKATPFCHAPCMVKKEAFDAVKGYSEENKTLRVEDYDLWVRMMKLNYKGYNLNEPLYKMRDDRKALNRRKFKYRINEFYIKLKIFKDFKLPLRYFIYTFRPILVGMMPKNIYKCFHIFKLDREREKND